MYDKDSDRVIFESVLPESCPEDIARIMAEFPNVGVEIHRGFEIWSPRVNRGVLIHLGRIAAEPIRAQLRNIPQTWTKFAIFSDDIRTETAESHSICDFIRREFPGKYEPVVSGGIADVAPSGITKASGVIRLMEMLKISRDHLYCIGDSWNDLPMLYEAREGFIPESAAAAIPRTRLTPVRPAHNAAVANVVEILDKRY
jgi:hypothetical protein